MLISIPDDLTTYKRYPEESLFKFDPLPKYLTLSRNLSDIIREQQQECLRGVSTACVPDFSLQNLIFVNFQGPSDDDTVFPEYKKPESLPQLHGEVNFLDRHFIRISAPPGVWFFEVEFESRKWLLKAFLDDSSTENPSYINRFKKELNAYSHFKASKHVIEAVPHCPGWIAVSQAQIASLRSNPKCRIDFEEDPIDFPLVGILMEYFPDAENLSDKNITFALAENAMRGICSIHECYVVHNDIAERNCLVVSGNRVVWVDFDISFTPVPGRVPKRAYYWLEVDAVWELLYRREIPIKPQ